MARIDDEVKTKFQNDRHRFVANIMYTSGWIRSLFVEFLKPYGLSTPQFNILRILRGAKDWVAMTDVKNLMVEKAPNTTRLADKLLSKGLIERKRSDADRRIVYVHITHVGLDLLMKIDEQNVGIQNDFMERITEAEAKQMSDVLDKLRG